MTPITVSTNTPGTAFAAGTTPYAVAFSSDGSMAYIGNSGSSNVTPITVSSNTPSAAFGTFGGAFAIATLAGAVPTAVLAQPSAGTVGSTVNFSAAGSSSPDGTISTYTWDFGDGTTPVTQASATITHTYAYGSYVGYAASVKVADSLGAVSAKAVQNVKITGTPWAQVSYVVNSGANTVSEVNLANNTTMATVAVGALPYAVAA